MNKGKVINGLSEKEISLGVRAADIIRCAGGMISFDKFDALMSKEVYYAPLNWCQGIGLGRRVWKANTDKLCIFAACKLGLVEPIENGYRIKDKEKKA